MADGGNTRADGYPLGIYSPVLPILAPGQAARFPLDIDSIPLVRTAGPAPSGASLRYTSTQPAGALVTSGVIKAAPGFLRQLQGRRMGAGNRWMMLFNLAAVPANGTAPDWPSFPFGAGAALGFPFGFAFQEFPFSVGLAFALSTTPETLTIVGAAELAIGALYV